MPPLPQVAVLLDTAHGVGRGILQGVVRYQRESGPWSVVFRPHGGDDAPPVWLRDWGGDGVLAQVRTRRVAAGLKRWGGPVVDLPFEVNGNGFPCVFTDNDAIARLAVEYLRGRGLRRFGFCGWPRGANSRMDQRCDLFAAHAAAAGGECHVYPARRHRRGPELWEAEQDHIAAWVSKLPKPVGVMACYDERGMHLLAACRRAGVRVPDEVAVIGSDNDELLCEVCDPPLTSIHTGFDRLGHAAAGLLDRLMGGGEAPVGPVYLPPLRVVPRASTDVLAIDDPEVSAALRYIRDNAARGITVEDVLRAVPVSRTGLERRMKAAVGRSPKAEIIRVQLDRARELLAGTDLPLAAIAARVGHEHPQHLARMFRLKVGVTPGQYRRSARA